MFVSATADLEENNAIESSFFVKKLKMKNVPSNGCKKKSLTQYLINIHCLHLIVKIWLMHLHDTYNTFIILLNQNKSKY